MKSFMLCCIFGAILFVDFVCSAVTLAAKKQDGAQLVTFTLGHSFEIVCNATPDNKDKKVNVEWKLNGVPVEDVDSLKDRYDTSSKKTMHKLEIKNAKEDDIGNYTCSVDDDLQVTIPVFIKPTVKVPANLNTVELETLRIVCTVGGKPHSSVTWLYSNETLNTTEVHELLINNDRLSFEEDPKKNIENAVLVIENVQMWDRGLYTCVGLPPYDHKEINSTCMVRVKDKYAALWPFIGICAEVFVLCIIILIYEKKRNKTELDESDTDQSPDQKNTPDHKDSSLRHRQ